jgi:hypothetical protein
MERTPHPETTLHLGMMSETDGDGEMPSSKTAVSKRFSQGVHSHHAASARAHEGLAESVFHAECMVGQDKP